MLVLAAPDRTNQLLPSDDIKIISACEEDGLLA
jgi:hypothetical protein